MLFQLLRLLLTVDYREKVPIRRLKCRISGEMWRISGGLFVAVVAVSQRTEGINIGKIKGLSNRNSAWRRKK
jgi:hypothetical protein